MRISDWGSDVCSSDLPEALPARLTKARRRDRESPPAQLRDDDRDRRGGAFQPLDDVAPREMVGIVPDEIEDGLLAGGEEVAGAGELHLLSSCRLVACCAMRVERRSNIAYSELERAWGRERVCQYV